MAFLREYHTIISQRKRQNRLLRLHQEFMNGVKVRFLDRDEVLSRLVRLAKKLIASRDNVLEVSLFGSLARGNYGPGSDADIYILLRGDQRRFIDRIPEFLDHFSGVGVPVEVFPYTIEEKARIEGEGIMKTILREKIVLDARKGQHC
jgi:predicted nucleotidyltransferase